MSEEFESDNFEIDEDKFLNWLHVFFDRSFGDPLSIFRITCASIAAKSFSTSSGSGARLIPYRLDLAELTMLINKQSDS